MSAAISVYGNGNALISGYTLTSAADFTDFGYQSLTPSNLIGTLTRTFTIQNNGDSPLVLGGSLALGGPIPVQISGSNDFSVFTQPSDSVSASGFTTFTVAFVPTVAGDEQATVTISTNDPNNPTFTFAVGGKGLVTTNYSDGLMTAVITPGAGGQATNGTPISVNFTGSFTNGTIFDSTSMEGGNPTQFQLGAGQVIAGWDEGLANAQAGSTIAMFVPSSLGYGSSTHGSVPPNTPLLYTLNVEGVGNPTISVTANGNTITSGATASTADFTDFGYQSTTPSALIGTVTRTYTIANLGGTNLDLSGITNVQISGPNANDFSVVAQPGGVLAGGSTESFTIAFTPVDTGLDQATVTIDSNDPNRPVFTFEIQGIGLTTTNGTDGLMIGTLVNGTGPGATTGSTVTVNYTGMLTNGPIFDSSLNPGRSPFQVTLGQNQVIQGWEEGLLNAQVGESLVLLIPSALGYGTGGQGSIPGDAPLIFKIDVLDLSVPTIAVSGNGINIPYGDTATGVLDGTYLGTTAAGDHTPLTSTFKVTAVGNAALNFGPAPAITITGNDTVNFSASNYSIDTANGFATFTVTFTPSTSDGTPQTATVNIATNDPVHPDFTFDVAATYTPVNKPVLSVTGNGNPITNNGAPSLLNFTDFSTAPFVYNASIGRVSRTFTITDLGDATLNLTGASNGITVSGANPSDFKIGVTPVTTIGADQQTTFTVVFTPTSTGARSATITILTNDPTHPKLTFKVQGNAVRTTNDTSNFLEVATTTKGSGTINNGSTSPAYAYVDYTGWLPTGMIWGSTVAVASQFSNSGPLVLEMTNGKIDGTILQRDTTGQLMPSGTLPLGMTQGLDGILAGETRFLAIPSELGFGTTSGNIPANSNLLMSVTAELPQIIVYANNSLIPFGETSPSSTNLTLMGTLPAGETTGQLMQTYGITGQGNNLSTIHLTSAAVIFTGSGASAFSCPSINTSTFTIPITFHPSKPGTYSAVAHVYTNDPQHPIYQFTISATQTPWVDLSGTVGTINYPASGSLTSGAPTNYTIPVSITNNGNTAVSSTTSASAFQIYLHRTTDVGNANDTLLASPTTTALRGLGIKQTRTINFTAPIPITVGAGTYQIIVKANTNGAIPEFDATNNTATSARVVTVAQGFNDLSASMGTTSFAANVPIISGAPTLYKIPVAITNVGNIPVAANSAPVPVNVYVVNGTSSTQIFSTTTTALRNLGVGKTLNLTLSTGIPISIPTGVGDQFVVKVNETAAITESSYTNNNATTSQVFNVTQGFNDLAASMGTTSFPAGAPIISGSTAQYKIPVAITNLGNIPVAVNAAPVAVNVYVVNGTSSTQIFSTTTTALRNLGVGKTLNLTLSTGIPISIPTSVGDQLVVKVNENAAIPETSFVNNNATTSQVFNVTQGFYDLSASMGTTSFATNVPIISGAPTLYKIPVTVTNLGNLPISATASGVSLNVYLVNGTNSTLVLPTTTTALRNLGVNKSFSTTLSTTIPITIPTSAGDQFVVKVDENGAIADANLANNNATTSQVFNVTQGVYNVNGSLGASTYPVTLGAGTALTGKLTTIVANAGNLTLAANQKFTLQTVAFNTDTDTPTVLGTSTLTLGSWAPNHTAAFSLSTTLLAGLTSGHYQLESVLTPIPTLTESSTEDNTVTENGQGSEILLTVT